MEQYFEPYQEYKDVRDTLIMSMLHFEDPFGASGPAHGIKKDTLIFSGQNDPIHSEKNGDKNMPDIPGARSTCENAKLRTFCK